MPASDEALLADDDVPLSDVPAASDAAPSPDAVSPASVEVVAVEASVEVEPESACVSLLGDDEASAAAVALPEVDAAASDCACPALACVTEAAGTFPESEPEVPVAASAVPVDEVVEMVFPPAVLAVSQLVGVVSIVVAGVVALDALVVSLPSVEELSAVDALPSPFPASAAVDEESCAADDAFVASVDEFEAVASDAPAASNAAPVPVTFPNSPSVAEVFADASGTGTAWASALGVEFPSVADDASCADCDEEVSVGVTFPSSADESDDEGCEDSAGAANEESDTEVEAVSEEVATVPLGLDAEGTSVTGVSVVGIVVASVVGLFVTTGSLEASEAGASVEVAPATAFPSALAPSVAADTEGSSAGCASDEAPPASFPGCSSGCASSAAWSISSGFFVSSVMCCS